MEIEKKYLIFKLPNLSEYNSLEIEQGYLNRSPVLRIRKQNEDYIFTYKSKLNIEKEALMNNEIEAPLTKEAYEHLRTKIDDNLIQKTRYIIPLECGRTAELDIFHGKLTGLSFVEVEFENVEQAAEFYPPEWFGKDVTFDNHYRNGYLSTLTKYNGFE